MNSVLFFAMLVFGVVQKGPRDFPKGTLCRTLYSQMEQKINEHTVYHKTYNKTNCL